MPLQGRNATKKSPSVRVRSRLEIVGVNPHVRVSAKVASRLKKNWHGPMPVRYLVNGEPDRAWRINMMPLGDGSYRLYLNGEVRKASNVTVGDELVLFVAFDDEYRGGPQHAMPSWFGDELARNPNAKRGWEALPPSRQKEILRYFARLKSEEAKQRNLKKAMQVLAGVRGRFMARSWNEEHPSRMSHSQRRRNEPLR